MSGGAPKGSKGSGANRLIHEKSPCLLQHAHNPVNWHPWGEEAFRKAQEEDKPIFLSIGYSTCHWCHVMAHESFEDPQVAHLMNEAFVNVKVDREERPDVDDVYMTACQLLTGQGGWPLNLLLTPEGKPFFAATYIPKESRFDHKGMLELVPRVRELWETQRDEVLRSEENVTGALIRATATPSGAGLGEFHLKGAYRELLARFDPQHGGFGGPPKFPTPHRLTLLLRLWKRTGEAAALAMVERTLRAMRRGAIYDHVGFGFHRYSTDAGWRLPHFEKMLYDQALLTLAYLEAFQATDRPEYGRTAREILTYVLWDLRSPEGGFYSAEDADSEGEEGRFYLWTGGEIRSALRGEEAEPVMRAFNVEKEGNYAEEATGKRTGRNVLYLAAPPGEVARELSLTGGELEGLLRRARERLFAAREKRVRPNKDDKLLAHTQLLQAVDFALGPSFEVVIAGDPRASDTQAMLRAVRARFLPNAIVLLHPTGEREPEIAQVAPFVRDLAGVSGAATAYVCRGQRCERPTTDVERVLQLLERPG